MFPNNGNGADSDPDGDTLTVSQVDGLSGNVGTPVAGTSGGLFTITSTGSFTFDGNGYFEDLADGETRDTTITYQISDGEGGFDIATVTVTVTGANDAPTVATPIPDQTGTDAQTGISLDVTGAFTDADVNDVLSYTATGLPLGLSIDPATGLITGTLDNSASQNGNTGTPTDGVYTIVVTADDSNGGSVTDTFTYTVTNPAPIAQNDGFTGNEDTPATGLNVFANNGSGVDADPDGDTFTVSQVNGLPANVGTPVTGSNGGLFTLASDGTLGFDPNGAFENLGVGETASTSITYQISDGEGGVSTATVTYTVTGVNDLPVPRNPLNPGTPPTDPNAYIPPQSGVDNTPATPLDVTQFASDPDTSDVLTFTINPGELPPGLTFDGTTISGTYDPDASQGGPNNDGKYPVTLTVDDGNGGMFTTTILFDVGNPPPVAQDDLVSTPEDNVLNGNVFADNGNGIDSDPDNDAFTVTAVAGLPANVSTAVPGTGGGTFTINPDGSYTFDPGTDFNGLDVGEFLTSTITYTITDADGAVDTATVTVTINGANDVPVIIDPLNPGDPDNPIPATDPLNIIPDVTTATDGTPLTPIDVSDFVVDPDGEPLTYSLDPSVPSWIAIDPVTGIITGTPPHDASELTNTGTPGEYLVTVTVTDPDGEEVTTTVTINVANIVPVAVNDTGSVSEDGPALTGNVITGPGTDTDGAPDTDPLTVTLAEQGGNPITIGTPFTTAGGGVLTLNPDGSYTFNPGTAYNGLDVGEIATEVITYTIDDGNGGIDTATLTITINGANDVPVIIDPLNPGDPDNPIPATDPLNIIPDVTTATDGTPLTPIDVSDFVVDPDGEPLTYSLDPSVPSWIAIDPLTGIITGTPPHDASELTNTGTPGEYLVTVTVTDPDGEEVTTTVTINVANIVPVAVNDTGSVSEDGPALTGNVITGPGTDTDGAPDTDPLTVTLAEQGGNPITIGTPFTTAGGGVLTLNPDGSYTFNPGTAYNGLDAGETATEVITYTVDDGNGGIDTATLTITINGANDVPVIIDPLNPGDPDNPIPADPRTIVPVQQVFDADDHSVVPLIDLKPFVADPDGEPVTFVSLTPLPPGLTLNPDGTVTGVVDPSASQGGDPSFPGRYTITVQVSDGSSVTDLTLVIDVSNVPPVNTAPIPEIETKPSLPYTFDASDVFVDRDGDVLTYSASGLPEGLAIDPVTGVISGAPSPYSIAGGPEGDGVHIITVTVSDGQGGTASVTYRFVVKPDAYVAPHVAGVTLPDPRVETVLYESSVEPVIARLVHEIDPLNPQLENGGRLPISDLIRILREQDEIDRHGNLFDGGPRHYLGGSNSVLTIDGDVMLGVQSQKWGESLFIQLRDFDPQDGSAAHIVFTPDIAPIVSMESPDLYVLHWTAAPQLIRFEVEQRLANGAVYRAGFVLDTGSGEIRRDGQVATVNASHEPFADALRRHAGLEERQTKSLLAALGG